MDLGGGDWILHDLLVVDLINGSSPAGNSSHFKFEYSFYSRINIKDSGHVDSCLYPCYYPPDNLAAPKALLSREVEGPAL